jgi:C-terminal processing protease CtpA/Prc/glyoxylase-like metal-dependent hydrolase (beta-lactamase superfamily II)
MVRAAATATLIVATVAPRSTVASQDWDHITRLGEIWSEVTFAHPWVVGGTTAWDSATVAAIRRALRVASDAEFSVVVGNLLESLGDPATSVVRPDPQGGAPASAIPSSYSRQADVGMLRVPDPSMVFDPASQQAFTDATRDSSTRLVIDLRAAGPSDAYGTAILIGALDPVLRRAITAEVIGAAERRRVAYGFDNVAAFSSGQYRSALETQAAPVLRPLPDAREVELVFVLNRFSVVPPILSALQRTRTARVVFEGAVDNAALAIVNEHPLPDGSVARIRVADLILPDGSPGHVVPDTVAATGSGLDLATTLDLSRISGRIATPNRTGQGPAAIARRALSNPMAGTYPDLAVRLFAAIKFWHVIERHYPYLDLLEEPWRETRIRLLTQFAAAGDSLEYATAVAAAAVSLHDGHAYVAGGAYTRTLLPSGMPALRIRMIEGRPIVTRLFDTTLPERGIDRGAEVLAVDGQPIAERIAALRGLLSGSTPWGINDKVAQHLLAGPAGQGATVTLRGADGVAREVKLPRRHEDYTTLYHRERDTEVIREVAPGIGYADLDRLETWQVDSVFTRFADAKAIIFDMRGYPKGTAWSIAPRLAAGRAVVARLATPAPGLPSPEPAMVSFLQSVEPDPDPSRRFTGKTVLLIDERSQSQAEHTGLYLNAANGTLFVGGPTAGANGEITSLSLPGGYTIGFTGQAVTWPDGTQLQRRGLQPHVAVAPTIAGIRAGEDEVLAAAVRHLQTSDQEPGTMLPAQELSVALVGNAGVMLSDGNATLLVDLPYQSGAFGYDQYDPTRLQPAGTAVSVITHHHADHFDPALFRSGATWRIIGPPSVTDAVPADRVIHGDSVTVGAFSVVAIASPHTPDHRSYRVRWGDRVLHFTGDTEESTSVPSSPRLDILFVTPWLQCALTESGRAPTWTRTVIYHRNPDGSDRRCGEAEVLAQGTRFTLAATDGVGSG